MILDWAESLTWGCSEDHLLGSERVTKDRCSLIMDCTLEMLHISTCLQTRALETPTNEERPTIRDQVLTCAVQGSATSSNTEDSTPFIIGSFFLLERAWRNTRVLATIRCSMGTSPASVNPITFEADFGSCRMNQATDAWIFSSSTTVDFDTTMASTA